jgi:hypothetical protein
MLMFACVKCHTNGNRNAANLLLVFLNFYCLCVDGQDTLFPSSSNKGKKSNRFDFLPVLPEISGNSIAGCVDASVSAIAEVRATANQRAAFCFCLVLLLLLLLLFVLLLLLLLLLLLTFKKRSHVTLLLPYIVTFNCQILIGCF